MPWSGSAGSKTFARTTGLQSGSSAWADTKNAGRGIEASDHDTHDQDVSDGLNRALTKDGSNSATADISMGGFKLTTLGTPSATTDAANKAYVDAAVLSTVNATVRVASTANVSKATAVDNGKTLDSITLATGDRILLKNQTTASENGVWVVAASGAPARATDFDTFNEHVGSIINVTAGTVGAGLSFRCTANTGGTLNSTDINYVQFGTTLATPVSIANGGGGGATAADSFANLKQAATTAATGVLDLATSAQIYAATAGVHALTAANAAAAGAEVALVDGATITVDFSTGINFGVTLGGNRTLAASNYSGLVGRSGCIRFTQDGTGSRTLDSSASPFVNTGGLDVVLSTTALAVDLVFYQIVSIGGSAKVFLTIQKAVS